ncbi:hypothetical protein [uncultured Mobiluncus sp.]|uniref:hypothetical protein n=1 Tax=uncultured Mobiluncus sp. TaxID=293425 RepID=UPI0026192643|nr:hypothetical protein [uncultured Mobiluncus sp.]
MKDSHVIVHHCTDLDELPRRIKSQPDNFARVVVFDYLAHKNAERLSISLVEHPCFSADR